MYSLLLAIIYLAFISLGLPDSLLGSAWPALYPRLGVPVAFAGILTFIISCGTVVSSLLSDRLTRRFGAGLVTPAVLVSRGISFYSFLLLSGCVTLLVHLRTRNRQPVAVSPRLPKTARGTVVT